jgi:hypothetical protein
MDLVGLTAPSLGLLGSSRFWAGMQKAVLNKVDDAFDELHDFIPRFASGRGVGILIHADCGL